MLVYTRAAFKNHCGTPEDARDAAPEECIPSPGFRTERDFDVWVLQQSAWRDQKSRGWMLTPKDVEVLPGIRA